MESESTEMEMALPGRLLPHNQQWGPPGPGGVLQATDQAESRLPGSLAMRPQRLPPRPGTSRLIAPENEPRTAGPWAQTLVLTGSWEERQPGGEPSPLRTRAWVTGEGVPRGGCVAEGRRR